MGFEGPILTAVSDRHVERCTCLCNIANSATQVAIPGMPAANSSCGSGTLQQKAACTEAGKPWWEARRGEQSRVGIRHFWV